jgi:hypothetical protein
MKALFVPKQPRTKVSQGRVGEKVVEGSWRMEAGRRKEPGGEPMASHKMEGAAGINICFRWGAEANFFD